MGSVLYQSVRKVCMHLIPHNDLFVDIHTYQSISLEDLCIWQKTYICQLKVDIRCSEPCLPFLQGCQDEERKGDPPECWVWRPTWRWRVVQEYVHWMTYWIVLAAVTLAEEVADLLLGFWLPLYYEAKLVLLLWLISPVSRSTLALILSEPHVKC